VKYLRPLLWRAAALAVPLALALAAILFVPLIPVQRLYGRLLGEDMLDDDQPAHGCDRPGGAEPSGPP
jgi:hypothetical protein